MLKKILPSILVLGLAAGFAATEKKKAPKIDADTPANKVDLTLFDLEHGKEVYETNCLLCHGATGHGDGAGAAALNPKPRNLSDAKYMNTRNWKDLRDVVAMGGANSGFSALMPAWKGILKNRQIDDVLAYVLSLSREEEKPAKK